MPTKIVIIILLVTVLAALFLGLYFLFKDYGKGERALSALIWRIGLTVTLMVILLVGAFTGFIPLHGIAG